MFIILATHLLNLLILHKITTEIYSYYINLYYLETFIPILNLPNFVSKTYETEHYILLARIYSIINFFLNFRQNQSTFEKDILTSLQDSGPRQEPPCLFWDSEMVLWKSGIS